MRFQILSFVCAIFMVFSSNQITAGDQLRYNLAKSLYSLAQETMLLCRLTDLQFKKDQALKYKIKAIKYAEDAEKYCGKCNLKYDIKKSIAEYKMYKLFDI